MNAKKMEIEETRKRIKEETLQQLQNLGLHGEVFEDVPYDSVKLFIELKLDLPQLLNRFAGSDKKELLYYVEALQREEDYLHWFGYVHEKEHFWKGSTTQREQEFLKGKWENELKSRTKERNEAEIIAKMTASAVFFGCSEHWRAYRFKTLFKQGNELELKGEFVQRMANKIALELTKNSKKASQQLGEEIGKILLPAKEKLEQVEEMEQQGQWNFQYPFDKG